VARRGRDTPSVRGNRHRLLLCRRDPQPRLTLVLGAGNITAIPALDVLSALYQENSAVLVKLNPITDPLRPALEAAFAPLIGSGRSMMVPGCRNL
jgi:aldehyde dehydrogenase (NAD(P)+)